MHDFLVTLFYTFKKSGKLKRCFKDTAKALEVTSYNFPKVHGTRFIAHTRRGLDHLLKNWICLANTIESMSANKEHGKMRTLNAKLVGILKRLLDLRFLAHCCFYSHVLSIVAKLSLKLEDSKILVFEVAPLIEMAMSGLNDLAEAPEEVLLHDGHLPSVSVDFRLKDESGTGTSDSIECDLVKNGDMRKKPENRELNKVELGNMKYVNGTNDVIRGVTRHLTEINACLEERFESFRGDEFMSMMSMNWVDPANWKDKPEADLVEIEKLADFFQVPLQHQGFDKSKIRREWKDFRILVRNFYSSFTCHELWKKIFQFRQRSFPNICILVEHVLCIGATNGLVEAGFSHLTAMLSDRRLSTSHNTMENLLLIKINDFSWTDQDREEIIDSAHENYMKKRRVMRLESGSFKEVMSRGLEDVSQVVPDDPEQAPVESDDSDANSIISSADEDEFLWSDDDPLDDLDIDIEDYSNVLDPHHSHMQEGDHDMIDLEHQN
jgi:hypothetical protein